jgi:hypothetical protein
MTIIPVNEDHFTVQWDVSASYNTPLLTDQKLEFLDGDSTAGTIDVGLPPPVNNKFSVIVPIESLLENKSLTARVHLIGPGGTTLSPSSEPFILISAPINIAAPIIVI